MVAAGRPAPALRATCVGLKQADVHCAALMATESELLLHITADLEHWIRMIAERHLRQVTATAIATERHSCSSEAQSGAQYFRTSLAPSRLGPWCLQLAMAAALRVLFQSPLALYLLGATHTDLRLGLRFGWAMPESWNPYRP